MSILGGWVTNPNGWNCVSGGVVPGADLLIGTLINEAFGHPVPFLTTAARLNLGFRWALLLDYPVPLSPLAVRKTLYPAKRN